MLLPKFSYFAPKSLKEALSLLSQFPKESKILAGGTDLLVNMKHRLITSPRIISLKDIPDLNYIREDEAGLKIGALTTLHSLITSFLIQKKYLILAWAAQEVGSFHHQVMGTLGGNLCQENRCINYNQSFWWRSSCPLCYKAGGEICYIVNKKGVCYSTYRGDLAPVLMVLGAKIKIASLTGERIIPLKELYTQEGEKPFVLEPKEVIREIQVPSPLKGGKGRYFKYRRRGSIDFPLMGLALFLKFTPQNSELEEIKIALTGVSPAPLEAKETEEMLKGRTLTPSLMEGAALKASGEVSLVKTDFSSPRFKRQMIAIFLKKALSELRKAEK